MAVPPRYSFKDFKCDCAALREARKTNGWNVRPQRRVVTHSSRSTYLAQPCGSVNILLDAIKNRAVVFQEDAVRLSTATLQGLGLVEIGGQHLEVQPLRLRITHPYRSARCDVDGLSNSVKSRVDSNEYTGCGSEQAFDMSVSLVLLFVFLFFWSMQWQKAVGRSVGRWRSMQGGRNGWVVCGLLNMALFVW